ncbi:MAG: hypothetical protein WCA22_18240, partial [Candidatus Binatus sp.]
GEAIWAQPMILAGESLGKLTRVFAQLITEARDDNQVLRFRNFLKGKSAGGRPAFADGDAPMMAGSRPMQEDSAAQMQ